MYTRLVQEAEGTSIRCHLVGTGKSQTVHFACLADTPGATRWAAAFRRIHRVEMAHSSRSWECVIVATGSRLPVRRPVSLGVALGLGIQGVPLAVLE